MLHFSCLSTHLLITGMLQTATSCIRIICQENIILTPQHHVDIHLLSSSWTSTITLWYRRNDESDPLSAVGQSMTLHLSSRQNISQKARKQNPLCFLFSKTPPAQLLLNERNVGWRAPPICLQKSGETLRRNQSKWLEGDWRFKQEERQSTDPDPDVRKMK